VTRAKPAPAFLVRRPAHFLALGFGVGLIPFAPGTFGTLLAIPIAMTLWAYTSDAGFLLAIAVLFGIGIWACAATGRALGSADHGAIVWDETVAFLLVLYFVGNEPWRIAVAFVLFRVFDILKPPPIEQFDAAQKNGFGVMGDDILAAGYTLILFALGQRILS
jgi:phosphatidylglycerophosphatase A